MENYKHWLDAATVAFREPKSMYANCEINSNRVVALIEQSI